MFQQLQKQGAESTNSAQIQSLAKLWAKKYVQSLENDSFLGENSREVSAKNQRVLTAQKLRHSLRSTSVQAWNKTEYLIGREIQRHRIDYNLIDQGQITEDTFNIFEKALESYAQMLPAQYLSREIGSYLGRIRKKYTSHDPRVIGFFSMQFHYTGQIMLAEVSQREKNDLLTYFKVIDDHLYMPLQRVYDASGSQDYDSPRLAAVQKLLPASSEIARNICQRVIELYPHYFSYTGSLSTPVVKTASIRDVEMFQVYLWVCVLEDSIAAIQQELFPLCVMLYPTLKVRWELVRQMINLLGKEIGSRTEISQQMLFTPYFQALREMFSPEVFPESWEDEISRRTRKAVM